MARGGGAKGRLCENGRGKEEKLEYGIGILDGSVLLGGMAKAPLRVW
jgi:hypothetical protein